jgi:hypothetical protein
MPKAKSETGEIKRCQGTLSLYMRKRHTWRRCDKDLSPCGVVNFCALAIHGTFLYTLNVPIRPAVGQFAVTPQIRRIGKCGLNGNECSGEVCAGRSDKRGRWKHSMPVQMGKHNVIYTMRAEEELNGGGAHPRRRFVKERLKLDHRALIGHS